MAPRSMQCKLRVGRGRTDPVSGPTLRSMTGPSTVDEAAHAEDCTHDHDAPANPGPGPAWLTPVLVGGLALIGCVVLAVRDPNERGSYGLCPFKAVTGLDCPGC